MIIKIVGVEEFRNYAAKVIRRQVRGLAQAKIQFSQACFRPGGSGAAVMDERQVTSFEEFGDFAARAIRKVLGVADHHL
jgi:enhancing lycopene biosynthesis protein 2